jgi:hypothetical protein
MSVYQVVLYQESDHITRFTVSGGWCNNLLLYHTIDKYVSQCMTRYSFKISNVAPEMGHFSTGHFPQYLNGVLNKWLEPLLRTLKISGSNLGTPDILIDILHVFVTSFRQIPALKHEGTTTAFFTFFLIPFDIT